jgi:hypothetical protein
MRRNAPRSDPAIDALTRKERSFNAMERAPALVLARITNATLISNARYTYTWEEAQVTGTTPAAKAVGLTGSALSVSELSNGTPPTFYSYGVSSAHLIGTFSPKQIPVGTFVILSAFRRTDGSLMWLIINTQAISGECP